jgi:hypothetical protein
MIVKLGLDGSVVEVDRSGELDEGPEAEAAELAGTYKCPVCGETVKAADLGAALYHQRPNHKADDRRR